MNKMIGNQKVAEEALVQMREMEGSWAAYQNHAMDSSDLGGLRFLRFGEGATFAEPPERYPDTPKLGTGWRHLHVGTVNLETGDIE